MAAQYAYGQRETLIIAVVLDAMVMLFSIFMIVDVLKGYHLQYPMLKYAALVATVVAGIVAWMITTGATIGTLATLTVGNAWHTVTCLMMDSVTQQFAASPGHTLYNQTQSTTTTTTSTTTNSESKKMPAA